MTYHRSYHVDPTLNFFLFLTVPCQIKTLIFNPRPLKFIFIFPIAEGDKYFLFLWLSTAHVFNSHWAMTGFPGPHRIDSYWNTQDQPKENSRETIDENRERERERLHTIFNFPPLEYGIEAL